MTRDEAIQKAMKLLKLANSDNVHEAALAAQRAQEILLRYEINMAMLDENSVDPLDEEDIVDFQSKGAPLDVLGQRKARWKTYLADTVAKANQCEIYTSGPKIALVGRPSNADTVRYVYAALVREVEQLADKAAKGCGRTWANNYRLGVVDAIAKKFAELSKTVADDLRKEAGDNSTALVKVNNAIAIIEKRQVEVKVWIKKNLKLKNTYARSNYDPEARNQGRADGANININRGRAGLGSGTKQIS